MRRKISAKRIPGDGVSRTKTKKVKQWPPDRSIENLALDYYYFYHKHQRNSKVKQNGYVPTKSIGQMEATTRLLGEASCQTSRTGKKMSVVADSLATRSVLEILATIAPMEPTKRYNILEKSNAIENWFRIHGSQESPRRSYSAIKNRFAQKLSPAGDKFKSPVSEDPVSGIPVPEMTAGKAIRKVIHKVIRTESRRNSRRVISRGGRKARGLKSRVDLSQARIRRGYSPPRSLPEIDHRDLVTITPQEPAILQREEAPEPFKKSSSETEQYTWLETWASLFKHLVRRVVELCTKKITPKADASSPDIHTSYDDSVSPEPFSASPAITSQNDLSPVQPGSSASLDDFRSEEDLDTFELLDAITPKLNAPEPKPFNLSLTSPSLVGHLFDSTATPSQHTKSSSWRTAVVLDLELGDMGKGGFTPLNKGIRQVGMLDFLTGETLIDEYYWGKEGGGFLEIPGIKAVVQQELQKLREKTRPENTKLYSQTYLKAEIIRRITKYVGPETIVIAFAGHNDMSHLGWTHDRTIDVQRLYAPSGVIPSLRKLSLKTHISGLFRGGEHDAVEDCSATRELAIFGLGEVGRYLIERSKANDDILQDLNALLESELCFPILKTHTSRFHQGALLHLRDVSYDKYASEARRLSDRFNIQTVNTTAGIRVDFENNPTLLLYAKKFKERRSQKWQQKYNSLRSRLIELQRALAAGTPLRASQETLLQQSPIKVEEHKTAESKEQSPNQTIKDAWEEPLEIILPALKLPTRTRMINCIRKILSSKPSRRELIRKESVQVQRLKIEIQGNGTKIRILLSELSRFWLQQNKLPLYCTIAMLQNMSECNPFVRGEQYGADRNLMILKINLLWVWRLQGFQYRIDTACPQTLLYEFDGGTLEFDFDVVDFMNGVPPHLSHGSQIIEPSNTNSTLSVEPFDPTTETVLPNGYEEYIQRYIEETIIEEDPVTTSQVVIMRFEPQSSQVLTDDGLSEVELNPIELYYIRQNKLPLTDLDLLTDSEISKRLKRALQFCIPSLKLKRREEYLLDNLIWVWRLQGFAYSIITTQAGRIAYDPRVSTEDVLGNRHRQEYNVDEIDLETGIPPHLMNKGQDAGVSDDGITSIHSVEGASTVQQSDSLDITELSPQKDPEDPVFTSTVQDEKVQEKDQEPSQIVQDTQLDLPSKGCPQPKPRPLIEKKRKKKKPNKEKILASAGQLTKMSKKQKSQHKDGLPAISQENKQSDDVEVIRYGPGRDDFCSGGRISWFANQNDDPEFQTQAGTNDGSNSHGGISDPSISLGDSIRSSVPQYHFPILPKTTLNNSTQSFLYLSSGQKDRFDLMDKLENPLWQSLFSASRMDVRLNYARDSPSQFFRKGHIRLHKAPGLPKSTHCLPREIRSGARVVLGPINVALIDRSPDSPKFIWSWLQADHRNALGQKTTYYYDRQLDQFQEMPRIPFDYLNLDAPDLADVDRESHQATNTSPPTKNHVVQLFVQAKSKTVPEAVETIKYIDKSSQEVLQQNENSHQPQLPIQVNLDIKTEEVSERATTEVQNEEKLENKKELPTKMLDKTPEQLEHKVKVESKTEKSAEAKYSSDTASIKAWLEQRHKVMPGSRSDSDEGANRSDM